MRASGRVQVDKTEDSHMIVSKSLIGYSLIVQNHGFRQSR